MNEDVTSRIVMRIQPHEHGSISEHTGKMAASLLPMPAPASWCRAHLRKAARTMLR